MRDTGRRRNRCCRPRAAWSDGCRDGNRLTIPFEALIFDVDGTLYCQGPLRRRMLLRLLAAHLRHPWNGLKTMRMLSAYRKAQETLRWAPEATDFASAQIALAARRIGANP